MERKKILKEIGNKLEDVLNDCLLEEWRILIGDMNGWMVLKKEFGNCKNENG